MLLLRLVILIALTLGLLGCSSHSEPANSSAETPTSPRVARSNSVLIQFKGFEYWKTWVGIFEIINDTDRPIIYVGSDRKGSQDYCTLAVRQKDLDNTTFRVSYGCYFGSWAR